LSAIPIVLWGAVRVVADTQDALTSREAGYPPIHDIARRDIDIALLQLTDHSTYSPYKGECAYFSIPLGGARSTKRRLDV
jgi:uncharacterized protein (DUF427 family)